MSGAWVEGRATAINTATHAKRAGYEVLGPDGILANAACMAEALDLALETGQFPDERTRAIIASARPVRTDDLT